MKYLYLFIFLCYTTICFAGNVEYLEEKGINCHDEGTISEDFLKMLTIKSFLKLYNNQNRFYQIDFNSIRKDEVDPRAYYLQFKLAQCPNNSFPFLVTHVCLPNGSILSVAMSVEVDCE